jgi:hypothetical protein
MDEVKNEDSATFSSSIKNLLAQKKVKNVERPEFPLYNSPNNDLLSIRAFFEIVKNVVPYNNFQPSRITPEGECK